MTVSDDTLYPKDEYLADYMTEFSKHYFGHPSEFPSLYFDRDDKGQPTSRRTLQHKISLRNASHGRVTYLSSVEAVVDVLETAEFPWNRLTVTPQVSAKQWRESDHRSLRVKSDGVGPAIDAEIVVTARSGLTVGEDRAGCLSSLRDRSLCESGVGRSIGGSKEWRAVGTAIWRLTTPPSTPVHSSLRYLRRSPESHRHRVSVSRTGDEADYGWYEQITELSRLRALGPSGYAEPYQLQVSYASLKGEHKTLTLAGTLGTNEVFFAHHKRLLAYDPRCEHVDIDRDGIMDELDAGGPLAFLFASDKSILSQRSRFDHRAARNRSPESGGRSACGCDAPAGWIPQSPGHPGGELDLAHANQCALRSPAALKRYRDGTLSLCRAGCRSTCRSRQKAILKR